MRPAARGNAPGAFQTLNLKERIHTKPYILIYKSRDEFYYSPVAHCMRKCPISFIYLFICLAVFDFASLVAIAFFLLAHLYIYMHQSSRID